METEVFVRAKTWYPFGGRDVIRKFDFPLMPRKGEFIRYLTGNQFRFRARIVDVTSTFSENGACHTILTIFLSADKTEDLYEEKGWESYGGWMSERGRAGKAW